MSITKSDKLIKVSDHPDRDKIERMLRSGEAVVMSPVAGLENFKWNDEVQAAFESAMQEVHGYARSAQSEMLDSINKH